MEDFGCGDGGWTPIMKIDGNKAWLLSLIAIFHFFFQFFCINESVFALIMACHCLVFRTFDNILVCHFKNVRAYEVTSLIFLCN